MMTPPPIPQMQPITDAKKLMRQEFLVTLKKSVTEKSRRGQGASDPRNSSKKSPGKTALSPEEKEETTKAASAKAPVNEGQHRGTTVTGSPTEGKIESENGGTDE